MHVCECACLCVRIISKLTESAIHQGKMFPCFLHELLQSRPVLHILLFLHG